MKDGEMSQEEIDKLLNGNSEDTNNDKVNDDTSTKNTEIPLNENLEETSSQDGEMSQEEIDKLLNGNSEEISEDINDDISTDNTKIPLNENLEESSNQNDEMSQEEIDRILNRNKEDNRVKNNKDGSSGGISQEEIDNLLKAFAEENENTKFEITQENIDKLLRVASNEMTQGDIDKILQAAMAEEEKKHSKALSESSSLNNNNKETGVNTISQNEPNYNGRSSQDVEKSQIDLMEEKRKKRNSLNLSEEEKEVISELMSISYNEASTTLTTLLGQKVAIKNPIVEVVGERDVEDGNVPHVILSIHYTKGLEMKNTLVLKKRDALYISDTMMSTEGSLDDSREMDDMALSAIKEAVNQMMGKSATAMFQILQQTVDISPPDVKTEALGMEIASIRGMDDKAVCISMELEMGANIKSKIYQLISLENAKEIAKKIIDIRKPEVEKTIITNKEEDNSGGGSYYVNPLFEDVTVKMELVYGTTRKTLKDFLSLEKNYVIELKEEVYEPLKLYANGILIAEGDLVNVDGYYGIRIQKIC